MLLTVVVLGAGGHGAVVAECAREMGGFDVVGFLDDNADLHGSKVLGLPVLGPINALCSLPAGVEGILLAVGRNQDRLSLLQAARDRSIDRPVLIHPRAWVSPSAQIASGTFVAAGAMIGTRAVVGGACIINTGASVDHDCVIGDGVHIAPGARCAGTVTVGATSLIGMGCSIIEGIHIATGSMIAAGSVVIRDTTTGQRLAGVPARPMRVSSGTAGVSGA